METRSLPMMDAATKRQRYRILEKSISTMRCRQQRRRRTGALRHATTLPAVASPSRSPTQNNKRGSKGKSKRVEESFEDLLNKPLVKTPGSAPATSRSHTPAPDNTDDRPQTSVEETKAKKMRTLKARLMELTETYNVLVGQVIERQEVRDDLRAARGQLKQQERNIQRSRDEIADTLEELKQKERAMRVKVKEAQRYSNVLMCMRERQVQDLMVNKQIYEKYDKLSKVFEIEVEDTQKEALESTIEVRKLERELAAVKRYTETGLVSLEQAVKDATVVVAEQQKKVEAEERELQQKEEQKRQKAVNDSQASVIAKMEGKMVVQKTLQLKKHFEVHQDAFQKIWLATGLAKEEQILDRFHNQDAYVNEAQTVVRRLQLQVYDMTEKNEQARQKLNVAKYTSSQLGESTKGPSRREPARGPNKKEKQEDMEPHTDAWWRAELTNKGQELAIMKKSWHAIQHSRSRVGQFAALLSWNLQKFVDGQSGESQSDGTQSAKSIPPLPEAHASEKVMEHMDNIESNITSIIEWLLSDVVVEWIQRAREDASVRIRYKHNPSNLRVARGPSTPTRKKQEKMKHSRDKRHLHSPENPLLTNPLLMKTLIEKKDLDALELERKRDVVMSRKDMKNMSLARFRVCTPMQVQKDMLNGTSPQDDKKGKK